MDAFLYPELFYGSGTSSNSLFKVNNSHFDKNKRFVNLNHKIKLNQVEAQKLNSELLKFNYGSKRELTQMLNTNNRKSSISVSSTTPMTVDQSEKVSLPKVQSKTDDPSKLNLSKTKSELMINTAPNAVPAIFTEMSRQSLEINPVISVEPTNNNYNSNHASKRYFYRYLLNKKYNSNNTPQQIFANVALQPPLISSNSGTNKSLSKSHSNVNEQRSSSSFSNNQEKSIQPKEYSLPTLALTNDQIIEQTNNKPKNTAHVGQSDFVEGSKLAIKNDELTTRKLSFREIFSKGSKTKESDLNTTISSDMSNSSQKENVSQPPFQTQFRLKPLQPNSNISTKNSTSLDLSEESAPFINLKIEKKQKTEKVPINKLRTQNKNDELTIVPLSSNLINNQSNTNNTNNPGTGTPTTVNNAQANSKTKLVKLTTTLKQKFTSSYSSFNKFNFEDKIESKTNSNTNNTDVSTNRLPLNPLKNSHNTFGSLKNVNKFDFTSNSQYFDIEFTRVQSPHVLGKSTDECMFISHSSSLNGNTKKKLNQHFDLYQSSIYDNSNTINNSNNNNGSNLTNTCVTNNTIGSGVITNSVSMTNLNRNEAMSNNSDIRKTKVFNFQKLNIFENCMS